MNKKLKSSALALGMIAPTITPAITATVSAAELGEIPYKKVDVNTFKSQSEGKEKKAFLTIHRAGIKEKDVAHRIEILDINDTSSGAAEVHSGIPQLLNTNYPEDREAAANSQETGGFSTVGPMSDYALKQKYGVNKLGVPELYHHNAFMVAKQFIDDTVYPKFRGGRKGSNVLIPEAVYAKNQNAKIRITYPGGATIKKFVKDDSASKGGPGYHFVDEKVDVVLTLSEFVYKKDPQTDYDGVFFSISNDPLSGARPKNSEAHSAEYEFIDKQGRKVDPTKAAGMTAQDEAEHPELTNGELFMTFGSLNYYVSDGESVGLISPTNKAQAYLSTDSNVEMKSLHSATQESGFDQSKTVQTKWNSMYEGMKVFGSTDNTFVDNLMSSNYERNAVTFGMGKAESYKFRLLSNVYLAIGSNYTNIWGGNSTFDGFNVNGWQFPLSSPLYLLPSGGDKPYFKPVKTVTDSDEINTWENWMDTANGEKDMEYTIDQKVHSIPGELPKYYSSFVMEDRLPDEVDYVDAKIMLNGKVFNTPSLTYDQSSRTVRWAPNKTELGHTRMEMVQDQNGKSVQREISVDGTMPMKGETYQMKIKVRLNDKATKSFDNKATTVINGDNPLVSQKVTTHPNKPSEIDIEKQVITPSGTNKTETSKGDDTRDTILGEENEYRLYVKLPSDVRNFKTLEIEDTLSDQLDLVKGSVKAYRTVGKTLNPDTSSDYTSHITTAVDGKKMTISANDKTVLGEAGNNNGLKYDYLTISFKAKLNDTAVPDAKVPNAATVNYLALSGDKGNKKSNTVFVFSERAGDPNIRKDVEGQELYFAEKAGKKFNYNLNVSLPKNAHKYEKIVVTDEIDPRLVLDLDDHGQPKISAKLTGDVEFSDYVVNYNKETRRFEFTINNFKALENKNQLTITMPSWVSDSVKTDERIPNKAKVNYKSPGAIEKDRESNEVKVYINPSDEPTISKLVESKLLHEDVIGNEYTYTIDSTLPTNIETYEMFEITDTLDERIDYINNSAKVTVDGEVDSTFKVNYDEKSRTLKVTAGNFDALKGKKAVNIAFKSKMNEKAKNLEAISNVADVEFKNKTMENSKKKRSPEPAIVKPKKNDEKITIKKFINDEKTELDTKVDESFVYTLRVALPSDIDLYNQFTITDKLDPRIDYTGLKDILVDGVKITDASKDLVVSKDEPATYDKKTRILKLDIPKDKIKNLKGAKNIDIVFNAKANVVDVEIPNIGVVNAVGVDGGPQEIPSNKVIVNVKTEQTGKDFNPTKTVEGKQKHSTKKGESFTYRLQTPLPNNIKDYKSFKVTDMLDDRLDLVSAPQDFVVKSGGRDLQNADYDIKVDGKKITVSFKRLDQLEKEVYVEFKSKIVADLKASEQIPNKFDIHYVDPNESVEKNKTSNEVVVENPEPNNNEPQRNFNPVKKVDGKEKITSKKGESFTYRLSTTLPNDIKDYKSFKITDTLDPRLELVSTADQFVVRTDEKELVKSDYGVTIEGKKITVDFKKLNSLGKEVYIEFKAKLLSDLKEKEQVPNKFEILYTSPKEAGEKNLNSNEVLVESPNSTTAQPVPPVNNGQGNLNGTQKNPNNNNNGNSNGPVKGESVKTGDSNKKAVFAIVIIAIGALAGGGYYIKTKKKEKENH